VGSHGPVLFSRCVWLARRLRKLSASSQQVRFGNVLDRSTFAMEDGQPFGIGGIWETWRGSASGEWIRTIAIITTDANELVAEIHDRTPLILAAH